MSGRRERRISEVSTLRVQPTVAVQGQAAAQWLEALAAAGCLLSNDTFDTVVVPGASAEIEGFAEELRAAGFRGVIVAVAKGATAHEAARLQTAGVNVIITSSQTAEVVSAVCRSWEDGQCNGVAPTGLAFTGLAFSFDENSRVVHLGTRDAVLSEARFKLLRCLAEQPGTWCKAADLQARVLGTRHMADSALIRVHMNGIRKGLGPANWCLQSERTFGYQFLTNVQALRRLGSGRLWSGRGPATAFGRTKSREFRVKVP